MSPTDQPAVQLRVSKAWTANDVLWISSRSLLSCLCSLPSVLSALLLPTLLILLALLLPSFSVPSRHPRLLNAVAFSSPSAAELGPSSTTSGPSPANLAHSSHCPLTAYAHAPWSTPWTTLRPLRAFSHNYTPYSEQADTPPPHLHHHPLPPRSTQPAPTLRGLHSIR